MYSMPLKIVQKPAVPETHAKLVFDLEKVSEPFGNGRESSHFVGGKCKLAIRVFCYEPMPYVMSFCSHLWPCFEMAQESVER